MLLRLCILIFVLMSIAGCVRSSETPGEPSNSPKVILIVGDGMDDQQISIARNFLAGSGGTLAMDGMQYRGAIRPQSVEEENPEQRLYVTSSAPSGTAIATGILTSGQRISTYPKTGEDAVTIMELANDAGIATGVITTASVTDATSAAFVSHSGHRSCQGPERMRPTAGSAPRSGYDCSVHSKDRGGPGSIAEQIVDGDMDVVLGGGKRYFEQSIDGESDTTLMDLARSKGFSVITEKAELGSVPIDEPVLGLFGPGPMPPALYGNDAVPGTTVSSEAFTCADNPEFAHLPRLVQMTEIAIRNLDARGSFILVVEDEAIDEHNHARQPCGHIGGVAQIDEVVRLALEYASTHPETLVLVTADHGHAAQVISENTASGRGWNTAPGHVAPITTADGTVMGINYGTSGPGSRESHTGVQVPLLATGPGVEELPVFMPQTEVFHIVRRHLGLGYASKAE